MALTIGTGESQKETMNLHGDDSRIIMDRVIPFIKAAADVKRNFFAVIWFHTPHLPAITNEYYRNLYSQYSENEQHYFGAITAMDEQIGRLRSFLSTINIGKNTLVIFNSDNGPEGTTRTGKTQGSSLDFRGRKRSLYEGGIRVPAVMVWPAVFKTHQEISVPVTTTDIFPTVISLLGIHPLKPVKPLDGIDFMPVIRGEQTRSSPICFQFQNQLAVIDDQYKLYSPNKGFSFELYDIIADRGEKNNLVNEKREIVENMKKILENWIQSCKQSDEGKDYD